MKKQLLTDQLIINCLSTDYGIKATTLTLLPLGADVNASVYKAQAQDQSSYFIKLKHGHYNDISATILKLLSEAGIKQIILPVKNNRRQSMQYIDDFTLIVFPFVEGINGFNYDLTDDQWTMLGKVMRQIHEIKVPTSVQNSIRSEVYSSKWREIVKSFYVRIESEPGIDEISLKLIAFMKHHASTIYKLIDRAEQLAQQIQNQSNNFVLCHSDIHAGNILINENNTIYIVDWDDPIMAPKERDLMFVGGGVANVWNKLHEEEFFYKGYGKTEINIMLLAYYRYERIVEDIADFCQQLLFTSKDGQNRIESYKHFIAQFEPQGVVDIAFRTDERIRK